MHLDRATPVNSELRFSLPLYARTQYFNNLHIRLASTELFDSTLCVQVHSSLLRLIVINSKAKKERNRFVGRIDAFYIVE